MATGSTYSQDIAVSCYVFVLTRFLYQACHIYNEKKLPKWNDIPWALRDRMCVEMAVLPSRLGMGYLALPIVLSAFKPMEEWKADDTEKSLLACSLMTGSYLFDLSIKRTDIFSTIHHCMGPALLLWIRISFSSFTPADALICRILILFVFFGGAVGGSASSGAIFLLRIGKRYLDNVTLYRYFALCLGVLTISTVASCLLSVLYIHHWFNSLYNAFGNFLLLPVLWEGFECYLQWRWLFRFHDFEKRFWDTKASSAQVVKLVDESVTSRDQTTVSASEEIPLPILSIGKSIFPTFTLPILKFFMIGWVAIYINIYVQLSRAAFYTPEVHFGYTMINAWPNSSLLRAAGVNY